MVYNSSDMRLFLSRLAAGGQATANWKDSFALTADTSLNEAEKNGWH